MYFYRFRCIVASLFLLAALIPFKTPTAIAQSPMLEEQVDPAARLAEADRLLEQGFQQLRIAESSLRLRIEEGSLLQQDLQPLEADEVMQAVLQSWQEALSIYRASDVREVFPEESRQGELITLLEIGDLQIARGRYSQSVELYLQSSLNQYLQAINQYSQAVETLQQALIIAQKMGDPEYETTIKNYLIQAYYRLGDFYQQFDENYQAIEYSQQALALS